MDGWIAVIGSYYYGPPSQPSIIDEKLPQFWCLMNKLNIIGIHQPPEMLQAYNIFYSQTGSLFQITFIFYIKMEPGSELREQTVCGVMEWGGLLMLV